MRNIFSNKIMIILAAVVAILALEVLASGINEMEFREATPYSWNLPLLGLSAGLEGGGEPEEPPPTPLIIAFWAIIITLTVILSLLISPKLRRLFLTRMLQGIAFAILFYFGLQFVGEKLNSSVEAIPAPAMNGVGDIAANPAPPPFVPPDSATPWSYVISLAVVTGIFLAGWWFFHKQRRPHETIRFDIAEIARETVGDIQKGKDWSDTIMRCYIRMTEAVNASRGIMRPSNATPAEFAVQLERAGLPSAPVRRLTRLFERVRYGGKSAQVEEQQEAISCLNSIISACEGTPL